VKFNEIFEVTRQKKIIREICGYKSNAPWGFALLGMGFGPKRQRARRNIPEERRPKQKPFFYDICPVTA
jgi:hypothetical protein